MTEIIDQNPPISAGELKIEFDNLSKVFRGDDKSAKLDASSIMMVLISRYLSNQIPSIDISPITALLSEYAHIANGGEPKFLKPEGTEIGRPKDLPNQMNSASIVIAIDILAKNGHSVASAIRLIAEKLGRKDKQIKQLRADFNRRKILPAVADFKKEQSSIAFGSKEQAYLHVEALLAMVKNN